MKNIFLKSICCVFILLSAISLISSYADTPADITYGKNETVTVNLPDGWYADAETVYDSNSKLMGTCGRKSYEAPLNNVYTASLDICKSLSFSNIVLSEKFSPNIYIFTAVSNKTDIYFISAADRDLDYIFYMMIYQSRISYTSAVRIAQSVDIIKNTSKPNDDYYSFVDNYIRENAAEYEVKDEIDTKFYTVLFMTAKNPYAVPNQKIAAVLPDGKIKDIKVYPFEGENKYSNYEINSFNESTNTLTFTRCRADYNMIEKFSIVLPDGDPVFEKSNISAMTPRSGTPIGYFYATDIKAYVDGHYIPSFSLNGRTVIVVEDLKAYGFNLHWDGENRILTASAKEPPETYPVFDPDVSNIKTGTKIGAIYATDIITEINGIRYETFAINGWMVVTIEDIGKLDGNAETNANYVLGYSSGGFRAVWNEEARTINLYCLRH